MAAACGLPVCGWMLPRAHAQSITIQLPGITIVLPGVNPNIVNLPGIGPTLNLSNGVGAAASLVLNQVATVNGVARSTIGSSAQGVVDSVIGAAILGIPPGPAAVGQQQGQQPGQPQSAASQTQTGLPQQLPTFTLGIAASHIEHDGYRVSNDTGAMRGVNFKQDAVSALPSLQWEASQIIGAPAGSLKLGVFSGYVASETSLGTNAMLRLAGIQRVGSDSAQQTLAGGYGLLVSGNWYGLALVGGGKGETEIRNDLLNARGSYDNTSLISILTTGVIMPAMAGINVDLRSQLAYSRYDGRAYVDSVGISYGKSMADGLTGTLGVRLFSVGLNGFAVVAPWLAGREVRGSIRGPAM